MLTINMIEKPHLFNPNDFPLTIDVAWREQLHQLHFGISLDKTNPHKANPDKMRYYLGSIAISNRAQFFHSGEAEISC